LLPGVEFQQAISVVEQIGEKTEDRTMYDQREKAQRDWIGAIEGAREEGREEGRQEGVIAGKIHVLQQLLEEEPTTLEKLLELEPEELSGLLADCSSACVRAVSDRPAKALDY
jgi:flagellar biosynthesis/type III secretory pathway protein FliH